MSAELERRVEALEIRATGMTGLGLFVAIFVVMFLVGIVRELKVHAVCLRSLESPAAPLEEAEK